MNKRHKTFEDYVIKSILANNEFAITDVKNLETLKSLELDREKYDEVISFVKKGYLNDLDRYLPIRDTAIEFLEIMQFKDQEGKLYFVSVYDNNELSQDPQVIEIGRL
jgi:hypothetical protein